MKPLLILIFIGLVLTLLYFFRPKAIPPIHPELLKKISESKNLSFQKLHSRAATLKNYIQRNGFSNEYAFLIDMSLPSGKKRFFVYDIKNASVIDTGLVAHGNCRSGFLEEPIFSNVPECGCSSVGKYKTGYAYKGQFGKAFKLHGLESTNSNAFKRTVVLHPYDCVPDEEVYPQAICNSLGCPMVSYQFMERITGIIEKSQKPILLWIYN